MKVSTCVKTPDPKATSKQKYPYMGVGRYQGTVVIFTEENLGMCIHNVSFSDSVGHYKTWPESNFDPAPVGTKIKITVD